MWEVLVDKKMSKCSLRKFAGISPNTMTKMRRDEPVMLSVLDKICVTLNCNYGDIIEFVPQTRNDPDDNCNASTGSVEDYDATL